MSDATAPRITAIERLTAEEFASLFARDSRLFWCLAASVLGRAGGADDVLQEAAVVALSKLDEFERGTSFTAWVARIVRFVAHNQRRKEARGPGSSAAPGGTASVEGSLAAAPELQWERASTEATRAGVERLARDERAFDDRLQRALAQLGDTARACLLLKTVLELDYREIAAALEIPEGTAMSHVHRAREALRASLGTANEGGRS